MLFNSINFILFFPAVTLVYFLFPCRFRYLWLLAASYFFYMCWNPKYALLLGASTIITYFSGILIQRAGRPNENHKKMLLQKKIWVALSFLLNLSILFFFKYFDFAIVNLNHLLNYFHIQMVQPAFDVILPVGISFYTFQALSYTMDVYRGEIYAEHNLAKYALFVSFFPQLVAGPIERSKNLLIQISSKHEFDYENMKKGLQLMLWGYFQKLVISDRVAVLVNHVYDNYTQYAGFQILIATLLFGIQIYCDFGGYSNIAIGAARVMGFHLMDNFRQPYFACSVSDFWRRWHISLSTWFRDYLYIPLGGNRKGRIRKYLNLMVVFMASGLWHGASWNFVIWGCLNGIYQAIGDALRKPRDWAVKAMKVNRNEMSHRLLKILVTYGLVNFTWIFFRAPSGRTAFYIVERLFSQFNPWVLFDSSLFQMGLGQNEFTVMIAAVAVLFFVDLCHEKGISLRDTIGRQGIWLRWSIYFMGIFAVLLYGFYGQGYEQSQFIYFQF